MWRRRQRVLVREGGAALCGYFSMWVSTHCWSEETGEAELLSLVQKMNIGTVLNTQCLCIFDNINSMVVRAVCKCCLGSHLNSNCGKPCSFFSNLAFLFRLTHFTQGHLWGINQNYKRQPVAVWKRGSLSACWCWWTPGLTGEHSHDNF